MTPCDPVGDLQDTQLWYATSKPSKTRLKTLTEKGKVGGAVRTRRSTEGNGSLKYSGFLIGWAVARQRQQKFPLLLRVAAWLLLERHGFSSFGDPVIGV